MPMLAPGWEGATRTVATVATARRTEARRLRRTMQWRQIRYIIILCVGGTFLLYLLLALICGWGFGRC